MKKIKLENPDNSIILEAVGVSTQSAGGISVPGDMEKSVYDTNDNGIVDKSDNAEKLDGYGVLNLPLSDNQQTALDNKEDKFTKNTAFNKDFGTTAGTVVRGDDPRLVSGSTGADMLKSVYDTNDNGQVDIADDAGFLQGYAPNELPISSQSQTALNNKEDKFTKNTAYNKDFGTIAGTVVEGNDPRLSQSMNKATYDNDGNGIVDNADKLEGNTVFELPISDAMQTELDNKEPAFTKNSAFNKDFGTTVGTVAEGNDSRLVNGMLKTDYDTNSNNQVDNSDNTDKLQGYTANELPISTASQNALDNKEDAFTKNTAFNKNFGTGHEDVLEGDDPRIPLGETFEEVTLTSSNPNFTLDPIASGKSYRIYKTTGVKSEVLVADDTIEYMDRIVSNQVGSITLIPIDGTYKIVGYSGEWYLGGVSYVVDVKRYARGIAGESFFNIVPKNIGGVGNEIDNQTPYYRLYKDTDIHNSDMFWSLNIGGYAYLQETPYLAPIANGFWQMGFYGKLATEGTGTRCTIIHAQTHNDTMEIISEIRGNHTTGFVPGFRIIVYHNGSHIFYRDIDLEIDTFQNITVTSEKEGSEYNIKIYVNGIQKSSGTVTLPEDPSTINRNECRCEHDYNYIQYLQVAKGFCTDGFKYQKRLIYN